MKKKVFLLYVVYFIVMVQIVFTGLAYVEGAYLSSFATGLCALATYVYAKAIRKAIGI